MSKPKSKYTGLPIRYCEVSKPMFYTEKNLVKEIKPITPEELKKLQNTTQQ